MRSLRRQWGFGGSAPVAQPVPVNPANDPAAEQARLDAERAAIADAKMRGRASTLAYGSDAAAQAQYERGLLKSQQRAGVSAEVLG